MMRADGHQVSTSTVERALQRRGLLLPRGFRADRTQPPLVDRLERVRDPLGRDLRICAVIDYATKCCLAARVTATSRGADALACLHAAVAEAERLLDLDNLRDDRGSIELVDEKTGEVIDVVPYPDRGPV